MSDLPKRPSALDEIERLQAIVRELLAELQAHNSSLATVASHLRNYSHSDAAEILEAVIESHYAAVVKATDPAA